MSNISQLDIKRPVVLFAARQVRSQVSFPKCVSRFAIRLAEYPKSRLHQDRVLLRVLLETFPYRCQLPFEEI